MAIRVRAHDWSATPLGSTEYWSGELKSAVMLVLDAGFPAALVWGDQLTTIYNDGFIPILGNKPDALGRSFADIWAEAWDEIGPIAQRAYAGEATFIADFPLVVDRSGHSEQAFFTFSYSPVRATDGSVAGMIDIVTETTADVRARKELQKSERYYRALVTAGTYTVYRMSPDWRLMYELDSETLANTSEPIENWVEKYILETDQTEVLAAIEHAIATKTRFELEHRVRLADGGIGWVLSRAVPLLGADGEIVEWFGAGSDVTIRHETAQQLRESDERYRSELKRQVNERTAELETSRDLLQATMDASTDMIQVFEAVRDASGEIVDFIWVLNNDTSEKTYGEVGDESLLQRNPGVIKEGVFDSFKRVTNTGKPEQAERYYAHEQFDGWFLQTVVKLNDGVATTTKEITAWKQAQEEVFRLRDEAAQARVQESEERLRQFGEASQDVLWIRDEEKLQWQYLTPAFETVYGVSREEALSGNNLHAWLNLILPEDRVTAMDSIQRVRNGEKVTFQYRIRRPVDGTIRWLRDTDFPMKDATGRVVRIGGVGHDITELKTTEEALAAAEQQQRVLLEGIPQLVWRAIDGGKWTWASPQWTALTGQREGESHVQGWLQPLHTDDRDKARQAWLTALETGGFEVDYRIRNADSGLYSWFANRATPVRDANGKIVEWLGTSTEIDELRRLQELQKTLLAELQHRVRNILAVIRSMMRRSSEGQTSLDDYVQHFDGRLTALARTQVLLTRAVDARVDLQDLIRDELLAQATSEDQVAISGLDIGLSPKAAEVMSLAIHELATNSVKYGALSRTSGKVTIEWQVEDRADDRWLILMWSETGVAVATTASRHQGFGTELITRRVPYELKGEGFLEMRPGGIQCRLAFPLRDRTSILQTNADPVLI